MDGSQHLHEDHSTVATPSTPRSRSHCSSPRPVGDVKTPRHHTNKKSYKLRHDDSDSDVLAYKPPLKKKRSGRYSVIVSERITALLRVLHILPQSRRSCYLPIEEPKVVLHRSRIRAILASRIHVLPVAVALALVSLNLTQVYLGAELPGPVHQDNEKLAVLQWAGKVHEYLIDFSLGYMICTAIHAEILSDRGLPLGLVLAAHQFSSPATLVSREFMASIRHAWKRRGRTTWRQWYLILLLPICVLLGTSVGPAATILMRPRLDYWPCGGVNYWVNSTAAQLRASTITTSTSEQDCSNDTGDEACPYGGYEAIMNGQFSYYPQLAEGGTLPESLLISSPFSQRVMRFRHRTVMNDNATFVPNPFTAAAVAPSVISDGLAENSRLWHLATYLRSATNRKNFRWFKDATSSVSAHEVSSRVLCNTMPRSRNEDSSWQPDVQYPNITSLSTMEGGPVNFANWTSYGASDDSTAAFIRAASSDNHRPWLKWYDDKRVLNATGASLVALVVYPNSPEFMCCSIGVWLVPAVLTTTASLVKVVAAMDQGGESLDQVVIGTDWNMTYPSAAWMNLTNPWSTADHMNAFSRMAAATGIWNSTRGIDHYNIPLATELILASTVTNAVARTTYNTSLLGTLKGMNAPGFEREGGAFASAFFPESSLGWGGDAYDISKAETLTATQYTMHTLCYGYAYSYAGLVQQISMAILLFYCLLAVTHMICLWFSKDVSNAWSKVTGLVALALNSPPSAKMVNTGAGIEDTAALEAVVKVKARVKQRCVSMVFVDTEEDHEPIRPDCRYG